LKHVNPLVTPAVTIRVGTCDQPSTASASSSNKKTLQRIGTALMGMLRAKYEHKKVTINGISPHDAVTQLKAQFKMYAEGKWPFNCLFDDNAELMSWWQNLSQHPDAQILAVCTISDLLIVSCSSFAVKYLAIKLFSMTPNSMADERTASTFSWFNSPYRSSQKPSTLVRFAQLRQHFLNESRVISQFWAFHITC
jgi:hypothetical protein